MNRKHFTVALLLLLAAGVAYAQEESGTEATELRIYDVSMLTTPMRPQIGPQLGPGNRQWDQYEQESEPRRFLEGDMLADLIRETIEPEMWDEGGDVQYREGGHLIVKARPAVLAKIEKLIRDLADGAGRRIRISAELYELEPAARTELESGATAAESLQGAKLVASGSAETMPGVQAVVKVTNRVRYVSEYDVEIAQGAEISDPLVATMDEGFALEVLPRATMEGDLVILQCLAQSGRFERPFRTLELGTDEEYFAKGFRSDRRYGNGTLELPVYDEADAFFTRVARSGESFVVPIQQGERLFALKMTALVTGQGGLAGHFDVGALAGRWRNPWFGFPSEIEPMYLAWYTPGFHDDGEHRTRLFDGPEEIMDLICQNISPEVWEADSTINVFGESDLLVHTEPGALETVRSFLLERESEAIAPVTLDLAVFSVAGPLAVGEGPAAPPAGAVLRSWARLDTLPHLRAGLQAGSRAAFLADYDVEVAQEARIADPIVGQSFAGITGNLTPVLSMDRKRMSVELSLLLAHRGPIGPFLTGTQYLGPIDRFDTARTVVNQTIELATGGSYWIDAGTDPADPTRRIAIRIGGRLN